MNDTTHSVFDETEWSKVLPHASKALGNEKENVKFLKKLVAVAVSNIVFLRGQLEDEAFVQRNLGSLQLRVLQKSKDATSHSNILIQMIIDGMSALDKGYLRKMSLIIFDGQEDAELGDMRKAYETYSFYFGDQDKDFSLTKSSRGGGDVPMIEQGDIVPGQLTEEYVMRTVKKLLRRLINGTQELDVLPDVCFLTICLEYYDNKTPQNYQPKGYEHTEYGPMVISEDDSESYLGMGQVDLMNMKMALRLRSKAHALNPDDELHPASLEKDTQSQEEALEAHENESVETESSDDVSKAKKMKMGLKRKQLEEETQEMEYQYNKKFKKSRK